MFGSYAQAAHQNAATQTQLTATVPTQNFGAGTGEAGARARMARTAPRGDLAGLAQPRGQRRLLGDAAEPLQRALRGGAGRHRQLPCTERRGGGQRGRSPRARARMRGGAADMPAALKRPMMARYLRRPASNSSAGALPRRVEAGCASAESPSRRLIASHLYSVAQFFPRVNTEARRADAA